MIRSVIHYLGKERLDFVKETLLGIYNSMIWSGVFKSVTVGYLGYLCQAKLSIRTLDEDGQQIGKKCCNWRDNSLCLPCYTIMDGLLPENKF